MAMKRLAWLTDVHLNFLDGPGRRKFAESVAARSPDAVLISGDVSESPDVVAHLEEMAAILKQPIYFVLGNHDYYKGSIHQTRLEVARMVDRSEYLVYLNTAGVVELTPTAALVGHDGWGDARLGDYHGSDVLLNDFFLIDELRRYCEPPMIVDRPRLEQALQALGDEAADHFRHVLSEAFQTHRRVVAVTHVPPFREAAWHQGKYSDDDWLPFFACKAVGDCLLDIMRSHPDRELLVLCGHTHGAGQAQLLDNLKILTGAAEYSAPAVQQVFEFE